MHVLISDRQSAATIDLSRLEDTAARAMTLIGFPEASELSLSLVDDREMALLNETYRSKKGTTNVLAFDLSGGEPPGAGAHAVGDVVVSIETCNREARESGTDFEERLLTLLVHGLLHLSGLGHHEARDADAMERRTAEVVEAVLAR